MKNKGSSGLDEADSLKKKGINNPFIKSILSVKNSFLIYS